MLFWQALEMLGILIAIALSIMVFAFLPLAIVFAFYNWSALWNGRILSRKTSTIADSVVDECSSESNRIPNYDWTNIQDR